MADNLETPSFGNFSIENTMEMGMGNAELINDLLSPETASSNPDEIVDIKEEAPAPAKQTAVKAPVEKKEEATPSKDASEDAQRSLAEFLMNPETEEGDEEDETPAPAQKAKAPVKKADAQEADNQSDENNEQEEQANSGTQFSALAKDLAKLGVFTIEEGEELDISTPEQFLERFQEEKRKGAIDVVNNFIGQFGEDYQKAFDAIFVKGVDPKEYFGTFNNIVSFSDMDLSQEANQVAVIKQALSDQGFDPEDINTEVERLKNYGDLETVATKHHKVLIKKEAAKLQELEQRSQYELQQKQTMKNQYIQNVNSVLQEKLKAKEFDGIPLNPKLVNELQDFLLVDKYRTASGETITDFDKSILELKRPENHEKKVKVALLLKILEKDPTLSTIQKNGISKKSDQLFGEVARHTARTSVKSSGNSGAKPNSWFL